MLISLIDLDRMLFEMINSGCSNVVFDTILPLWRNKYVWIPLYAMIIAFMLFNFGKKGYWVVLSLVITVASSDLISSRVIKPWVGRLRPCNDIGHFDEINVLVNCGGGMSFTSSHATNHFALAVFLFLWLGKKHLNWKIFFLLWAATISLAQVYVGVHYPLDIFGGSLLGAMIGMFWYRLYMKNFPHPLIPMT